MTSIIRADNISTVAGTGTIAVQAGNTLDASSGFVPPSGFMVQAIQKRPDFRTTVSSGSFVSAGYDLTITSKYANSSFLIQAGWLAFDQGAANTIQVDAKVYRNGTEILDLTHTPYKGSGVGSGWMGTGTSGITDSPGLPAGTAITYEYKFAADQGAYDISHNSATTGWLILQEIAG